MSSPRPQSNVGIKATSAGLGTEQPGLDCSAAARPSSLEPEAGIAQGGKWAWAMGACGVDGWIPHVEKLGPLFDLFVHVHLAGKFLWRSLSCLRQQQHGTVHVYVSGRSPQPSGDAGPSCSVNPALAHVRALAMSFRQIGDVGARLLIGDAR